MTTARDAVREGGVWGGDASGGLRPPVPSPARPGVSPLRTLALRLAISLVAVILLVAGLSGCSGAGNTAAAVAGPAPAAATRLLGAFGLVRSWAQVLYPVREEWATSSEYVTIDGAQVLRQWGTLSDGGTFEYFLFPDNSVDGTITWSGPGRVCTLHTPPYDLSASPIRRSGVNSDTAGVTLTWEQVITRSEAGNLLSTWTGTAAAPEAPAMTYRWRREQHVSDELAVALPDGSTLTLQCPTRSLGGVQGAHYPDFAAGLTGTYTAAEGVVSFSLLGRDGSGWTDWQTEDSNGLRGTFSLQGEAGAAGALAAADGETQAMMSWTDTASAALRPVGAQRTEVAPSAAALRYQTTRWISNGALLSPTPHY